MCAPANYLLTMALFSSGTDTRNLVFVYPESAEKWVEGMLKKAFLHFFAKFFKISQHLHGTLHIENSSNLSKIRLKFKKSLVRPCL